jgi:hypothetical protein
MRPATVHALAQLIRHLRGCVTTVEKWIAQTPPEAMQNETAAVIFLVRGALTDVMLGLSRLPAPEPAPTTTADRPAELAARHD